MLGASGGWRLPNLLMPPLLSNHGNFIVSLGDVCRYLARKAETLGVEIYPGFAAAEVLFENGAVVGIATGDMGIGKDGHHKSGFARGMDCTASTRCLPRCAGQPHQRSDRGLRSGGRMASRRNLVLALKELWQVAPEKHRSGLVQHTIGWPLSNPHRRRLVPLSLRDNLVGKLVSSFISTMRTLTSRRSKSSSVSRPIR